MASTPSGGADAFNASDLSVEVTERDGERAVVAISGEVDVSTAPRLRDELYQLLADGHHHLVLDLAAMSFIDSTGLGVLVGAVKRAREAGGDVSLAHPTRPARKVLDISGLSRIVEIVD